MAMLRKDEREERAKPELLQVHSEGVEEVACVDDHTALSFHAEII
jgi:hypothetical protein